MNIDVLTESVLINCWYCVDWEKTNGDNGYCSILTTNTHRDFFCRSGRSGKTTEQRKNETDSYESCGNCRYWYNGGGTYYKGVCKRRSPTIRIDFNNHEHPNFPTTKETNFCGDFKNK